MPDEKTPATIKNLTDLRKALKERIFSFETIAQEHVKSYNKIQDALQKATTPEQCIGLVSDLIVLVDASHDDCLTEISKHEVSKGGMTAIYRPLIDAGKVAANLVNSINSWGAQMVGYGKQLPIIPVSETPKIISHLEEISKQISDTENEIKAFEDACRLYTVYRGKDKGPKLEEINELYKKLQKRYSEYCFGMDFNEQRDYFAHSALAKLQSMFKYLDKGEFNSRAFLTLFPCTATYIRIVASMGGVSKFGSMGSGALGKGIIGQLSKKLDTIYGSRKVRLKNLYNEVQKQQRF